MATLATDLLEVPTIYFWPIFGNIPRIHMAIFKWYVYVAPSIGSILDLPLTGLGI